MRIEPFGTFRAPLSRVEFRGDASRGHRLVGPIVGATIDGPLLRATQNGTSAADWLLQGPDGTVFIDVRISMRTDDGAPLQITYSGRADWPDGVGSGPVRAAFVFETDAPQYRWLCSRMVVGVGSVEQTHGSYSLAMLH
ncbi:hypothetical protein HD600_000861 [Microbacterium ginsengiterrae]|uniref:Uncharacterized protein n=1 Tax=Microbacterium ginsengiterrae TaxID=546115 RepID=A0A7W9FCL2_9MICO|nr:hypothetical protein [Microbacterium ginsengiterrae]